MLIVKHDNREIITFTFFTIKKSNVYCLIELGKKAPERELDVLLLKLSD